MNSMSQYLQGNRRLMWTGSGLIALWPLVQLAAGALTLLVFALSNVVPAGDSWKSSRARVGNKGKSAGRRSPTTLYY